MDKSIVIDLNKRLLANLRDNTTDQVADEARVAASDFTCPELFARERQKLFIDTPQPVAFSAEIPRPGSYLAVQILAMPVLLMRDDTGKLGAFINACTHRGAPIASGSGQARTLVCPFHGWSYATDGSLRGRPEDASFQTPRKDCGLTPLPVSERYGIVVVSLKRDVSQAEMDASLADIGERVAGFGFEHYKALTRREFTVNANWKLVSDLSLESYHFKTLHRDTVAQILTANAVVDTYGRHSLWAFPLKSIADLATQDESNWPDTLQGSCTFTLYPGVMFIVNALGAQMIRAEPGATPGTSHVIYAGVCDEDSDRDAALAAYEFGGSVFEHEDLPISEECQRGITASGRDLILGRNEPLLQFWHKLWREAVSC